jgi:hypothetical protein
LRQGRRSLFHDDSGFPAGADAARRNDRQQSSSPVRLRDEIVPIVPLAAERPKDVSPPDLARVDTDAAEFGDGGRQPLEDTIGGRGGN